MIKKRVRSANVPSRRQMIAWAVGATLIPLPIFSRSPSAEMLGLNSSVQPVTTPVELSQDAVSLRPSSEQQWSLLEGIWFTYYSADLTESEKNKILKMVRFAAQHPRAEFGIALPADISGVEPDNADINRQRVDVICAELKANVIDDTRIHVGAFGTLPASVNRRIIVYTRG